MTLQGLFALLPALAAVCFDTDCGRIPNALVVPTLLFGLFFQVMNRGAPGILFFLGGAVFPFILLFPLFIFRMLGAGDIKLLMAVGGICGLPSILYILLTALSAGAILSFFLMLAGTGFRPRFRYFLTYISNVFISGKAIPYRKEGIRPENFHFSVPILAGVILYAGGVL
jgi:prepilin peptidase CpaA